jgi:Fe2+ transport system protein FeoA
MKKPKFNLYYIYDKKTGEVYHRYLSNASKKRLLRLGKLMGLKVKAKKENNKKGESYEIF